MDNNEILYHHGILGQRWGFRRYQNPDGSLTEAGRKRAQKLKSEFRSLTGKKLKGRVSREYPNKMSTITDKKNRNLTDQDLDYKLSRLRKEKELRDLEYDLGDKKGSTLFKTVGKEVVRPAAINAGRNAVQAALEPLFKKVLGVGLQQTKQAGAAAGKAMKDSLGGVAKDIKNSFKDTMVIVKNEYYTNKDVNNGQTVYKGMIEDRNVRDVDYKEK